MRETLRVETGWEESASMRSGAAAAAPSRSRDHITIGPRTAAALFSCVGVSTAYSLGAEWLTHPAGGVPAGLWLIGGAVGATHWIARARHTGVNHRAGLALGAAGLQDIAARIESGVSAMLASLPSEQTWIDRVSRRVSTLRTPTLRIGIDLREEHAQALLRSGASMLGEVKVEWHRSRAGTFDSARADLGSLDALVRARPDGAITVFIPEHETAPAGWYDWSATAPLSFAAVFPVRLDCAQFELSGCRLADLTHANLAAAMITAAACVSRASRDSVNSAIRDARVPRSLPANTAFGAASTLAFSRLAEAVRAATPVADPESGEMAMGDFAPFVKSATRVVAAWACSAEFDSHERLLDVVSLARRGLEHDPVQLLRIAAAEISSGEHDAGLRSLMWARRRLVAEESRAECIVDPLPFVQCEVEMGAHDPAALGRVCAGLALLWGTQPPERHAYIRDDITDDLLHAGWPAINPRNVTLIHRVMDELDAAQETDGSLQLARAA